MQVRNALATSILGITLASSMPLHAQDEPDLKVRLAAVEQEVDRLEAKIKRIDNEVRSERQEKAEPVLTESERTWQRLDMVSANGP